MNTSAGGSPWWFVAPFGGPPVQPGRYDAGQTIAEFAGHLKDAVDLDAIRDDLAGAVQAALEPAHVSVRTFPHD